MRPHRYLAMVGSGLLLLAGCSKASDDQKTKPQPRADQTSADREPKAPPGADHSAADNPAHDPHWGTIGPLHDGTLPHAVPGDRGAIAPPTDQRLVRIADATSVGDLDRSIVRRYVRRKLPRLKYCYQKQLQAHPELKGTVEVDFEFSPRGEVTGAVAKGIDESVSSCVADVIKTIQFPESRDGLPVKAHYAFEYRPPEE